MNTISAFQDSAPLFVDVVAGSGPQVTCNNAFPILVPYKRLIAWEVEEEGDEDRSGVADPACRKTNNAVCHRANAIKAETDFLANECHLMVVNGILGHHIKNPSVLFRG